MSRFDPHLVTADPLAQRLEWDVDDALTYALGVGIGLHDPLDGLEFVTENSRDLPQRTVVTFGATLAVSAGRSADFGGYDRTLIVHAGQEFTLHRELGPCGAADVETRVLGVHDLGEHALVRLGVAMRDAVTNEAIVTAETSALLRGAGGFGWPRPEGTRWSPPDRTPDLTLAVPTLPGQALLYRMSGDRNPLHSDPAVAHQAGFARPILHGMCTYGIAGHHLEQALLGGDRSSFHGMSARFTAPFYPGDELTLRVWPDDDGVGFEAYRSDGVAVLSSGRLTLATSPGGRRTAPPAH